MKHVFSRAGLTALAELAWSNVLLAFDFDGTLAPIVRAPARAALPASTRRLLERVARAYPCIVISGRRRADVARRMGELGLCAVVGNHGIEPWQAGSRIARVVRGWRPALAHLAALPGVEVEDKTYSIAVHYRSAPDKRRARAAILAAAAAIPGARLLGGKQVVNILPAGTPGKGFALDRERSRFGCATAVYVGDDETDEEAFALDPARVLAIRIGRSRASRAPWYLARQGEIDRLLRVLLRLRQARTATTS